MGCFRVGWGGPPPARASAGGVPPHPTQDRTANERSIQSIRHEASREHRPRMSQTTTPPADGPPLRITFEEGTLLVEGLPAGDSLGLPGLKFDPRRSGVYRAEAIWYR